MNKEEKMPVRNNNINKKFIELLKQICNNFKIDNYEMEIREFLKNR